MFTLQYRINQQVMDGYQSEWSSISKHFFLFMAKRKLVKELMKGGYGERQWRIVDLGHVTIDTPIIYSFVSAVEYCHLDKRKLIESTCQVYLDYYTQNKI